MAFVKSKSRLKEKKILLATIKVCDLIAVMTSLTLSVISDAMNNFSSIPPKVNGTTEPKSMPTIEEPFQKGNSTKAKIESAQSYVNV